MCNNLFIDKNFNNSNFKEHDDVKFKRKLSYGPLKWIRPKEICCNPSLYCIKSKCEPAQGCLDDCWLVSGSFILSRCPSLFRKIFQDVIYFDDKSYCGKWKVSLYDSANNKWVEVTIDDQLPTINNSLILGCCVDRNQFWFPLLEKACAKFYGSYKALSSGQVSEAFMLITGGFCWRNRPYGLLSNARTVMLKQQIANTLAKNDSMLAVVSKTEDSEDSSESSISEIIEGHYYVVTGMLESANKVNLCSMWIDDKSLASTSLSLPLDALCHRSVTVTFGTTNLASVFDSRHQFDVENALSSWQAGANSGGKYGSSTFESNPQYLVTFHHSNPGVFYMNLIQNNLRGHPKRKASEQALAIHVWKLSTAVKKPLCHISLQTNPPDYVTRPSYQYKYDVSLFGSLPKDQKYLVAIPSTFSRDVNCRYHLRICASSPFSVECLNKNPS